MLTPKCVVARRAANIDAAWSMQMETSGGRRLTDAKALTVIPTSRWSASRVVTTVMPDAKRPSTLRKVSGSIVMRRVWGWGRSGERD